ncbi:hypothetical protein IDZ49_11875 [Francisella tularensis]|nr:hypothetical protein [Francisella tularensis]MBD2809279.1 hypothetical protein [Francisella tularensis]
MSPSGPIHGFTSANIGRPNIYVEIVNSKYPQSLILSTTIQQAYDPHYNPDAKNILFMNQSSCTRGNKIAVFNLVTRSATNLQHVMKYSSQ